MNQLQLNLFLFLRDLIIRLDLLKLLNISMQFSSKISIKCINEFITNELIKNKVEILNMNNNK